MNRLHLLFVLLLAVVLCPSVHAYSECYTGFSCTSELQWDTANHEVWGYSETVDAYYLGRYLSVGAWLTTPSGQYYQEELSSYMWARVDFEGYYGNGDYYLDAVHALDYWGEIGSSGDETWGSYVAPPTGESTTASGWSDGYAHFAMTLTGQGNWEGATVAEFDPGGGGPDTCFDENIDPPIYKFIAITGGSWGITAGNAYDAYDDVGYGDYLITYYRVQGRTACGTSFGQTMKIWTDSGWQPYAYNTLTADILPYSAYSYRAGVPQWGY
jgi:hypothetical protein